MRLCCLAPTSKVPILNDEKTQILPQMVEKGCEPSSSWFQSRSHSILPINHSILQTTQAWKSCLLAPLFLSYPPHPSVIRSCCFSFTPPPAHRLYSICLGPASPLPLPQVAFVTSLNKDSSFLRDPGVPTTGPHNDELRPDTVHRPASFSLFFFSEPTFFNWWKIPQS